MRPEVADLDAPVQCEICGVRIEYWPGYCWRDVCENWDLQEVIRGANNLDYKVICDNCPDSDEENVDEEGMLAELLRYFDDRSL